MDRLTKARSQLVLDAPFWGRLAFRVKFVEDSNVETMATDGRTITYNPAFVDRLTNAELQFVIAHELAHCAFGHIGRMRDRDPDDWNIAADYAVNDILINSGMTAPQGGLHNPAYAGKSAEQVYGEIHVAKAETQPSKGDYGNCGRMEIPSDDLGNILSPAEMAKLESDWKVAAEQAAQIADSCGKSDSNIKREIERLRQAKIDWRAVLQEFVQSNTDRRYSWTKPNRRFVGSGIYLPSLIPDGVGEIVVAVDTSGSIQQDQLEQFSAEVFAAAEIARPETIHVVYCNTRVTDTETFTPDAMPDKLSARGGGGTRFQPVFDWVDDQGIDPACLVYLTDLQCGDWPDTPAYPVLWVSTSNDPEKVAPIGETIYLGGA